MTKNILSSFLTLSNNTGEYLIVCIVQKDTFQIELPVIYNGYINTIFIQKNEIKKDIMRQSKALFQKFVNRCK